jgi:L-threonylcarbamoyladenylate synthase
MKTLRLRIDPGDVDSRPSRTAIETAASILRGGGLVAFPTETVYGLGANALDAKAVEGIFQAKQRPAWDPLIVHISDRVMLSGVVDADSAGDCLPRAAAALISSFWPGPLTLLLPKADAVPPIVTAGRPLVGVRMPSHPVAHALIAAAGVPIAAPSANRFGRTSPTRADHVLEDLDGRIDAILDAGETAHGLESTVVDASQEPVVVYRPGIISLREIRDVCGSAVMWEASEASGHSTAEPEPGSMPSPGLGIRHYAPHARLVLIDDAAAEQPAALLRAVEQASERHNSAGIMLPANFLREFLPPTVLDRAVIFNWGDWHDLPLLAHRLFAGLRQLDAAGVEVILCPLPPAEGLGIAIQDRLRKAAKTE